MRKLILPFLKGPAASDVLYVGGTQCFTIVLTLLTVMFQARNLDTKLFGVVVLLNSVFGFILNMTDLGYSQYFFKNVGGDLIKEALLLKWFSYLKIRLFSLFILLILFCCLCIFFSIFEHIEFLVFVDSRTLLAIAINTVFATLAASVCNILQVRRLFKVQSLLLIASPTFTLVLQYLFLASVENKIPFIFLANAVGSIVSVLMFFLVSYKKMNPVEFYRIGKAALSLRLRGDSDQARFYFKSAPTLIISVFTNRIDIWGLASIGSATQVALYGVGQRFLLPFSMIAVTLNSIVWPRMMSCVDGNARSKTALRWTLAMGSISLFGLFLISVFGDLIIVKMFGIQFEGAHQASIIIGAKGFIVVILTPWIIKGYFEGVERTLFVAGIFQLILASMSAYLFIKILGERGAALSSLSVELTLATVLLGSKLWGRTPVKSMTKGS